MENNRGAGQAGRLGPSPGRRGRSGRPMSASRLRLLETLEGQPEPTTLASLSAATGLHANTVREHLDALARGGLVSRRRAAPQGRGRPAWLYAATDTTAIDAGSRASEYAGLAAALAGVVHRSSDTPSEDAAAAGEEWGRELARDRGRRAPGAGPEEARREVVGLLADVGFAPEPDPDGTRVRLTRCPLLEAAHRYPDIVCAVHLGLVRGALERYGGVGQTGDAGPDVHASDVRLLPFAEPGACLLHLPEARSRPMADR